MNPAIKRGGLLWALFLALVNCVIAADPSGDIEESVREVYMSNSKKTEVGVYSCLMIDLSRSLPGLFFKSAFVAAGSTGHPKLGLEFIRPKQEFQLTAIPIKHSITQGSEDVGPGGLLVVSAGNAVLNPLTGPSHILKCFDEAEQKVSLSAVTPFPKDGKLAILYIAAKGGARCRTFDINAKKTVNDVALAEESLFEADAVDWVSDGTILARSTSRKSINYLVVNAQTGEKVSSLVGGLVRQTTKGLRAVAIDRNGTRAESEQILPTR